MDRTVHLISYEAYDREIQQLRVLLHKLPISIPDDAQIQKDQVEAFKFLYDATFPEDRSADLSLERARVHAGLGDLAAKINKACSKAGEAALRPHLQKMVEGAVRMNELSSVIDDAANKVCELYVGCLALGRGWPVSLDDPKIEFWRTQP